MIFCVRQLVEKVIEHNTKVFLLFVDFCKAYDSVPRQALWCALRKYGIPENLIALVCSFYEGMLAIVTVCGEESSPFSVTNSLCQGCTIVPTLFILYLELVIQCWRSCCRAIGIEVQYRIGGKLVGERTRRPLSFTVSECLFADDAALICSSREHMDVAAKVFEEVSAGWGLTLSVPKTKLLVAGVGLSTDDVSPLQMNGGIVEVVKEFQYLIGVTCRGCWWNDW